MGGVIRADEAALPRFPDDEGPPTHPEAMMTKPIGRGCIDRVWKPLRSCVGGIAEAGCYLPTSSRNGRR